MSLNILGFASSIDFCKDASNSRSVPEANSSQRFLTSSYLFGFSFCFSDYVQQATLCCRSPNAGERTLG
jgi:hypothetical protein